MSALEIITFLSTALLLGLKHSLDTDHLIAVSTIISEKPAGKMSAIKGAIWGLGHTTTLFVAGVIVLFFKLNIPAKLEDFLEMTVGFVLIYLGLSLALRIKKNKIHFHAHNHGGRNHLHAHSHKEASDHNHLHKSFWVGIVHGLAGSATLMLIVLSSAKTPIIGIIFILIFGLGSMIGMAAFGYLASIPLKFAGERVTNLNNKLTILIASASMLIGLSIVFHTI